MTTVEAIAWATLAATLAAAIHAAGWARRERHAQAVLSARARRRTRT